MMKQLGNKLFQRRLSIPELWEPGTGFTQRWAQTQCVGCAGVRWVRCCPEFLVSVIHRCAPPAIGASPDPPGTLLKLFQACFPMAKQVLEQSESYTPIRILHMNDYNMEKAFVWGVIAFSKWLGVESFPLGVYNWPPARPGGAAPEVRSEPVHVGDDAPAPLRVDLPSASSRGFES